MKKISKILFFTSIIFVFFFLFGGKKIFRAFSDIKKDQKYLSLISEITALVKTRYVETVEPCSKFPGAFSFMLNSLDKFSAYLNPKKSKIYRLFQDGSVFSLGIYGRKLHNYFYVTDVIKNSPAFKNGLEYGDIIQAVNGKNLTTFSFWEILLSFFTEGPEKIELVIKKNNSSKINNVTLQTESLSTSPAIRKIVDNIYLITLLRIDIQSVQLIEEKMKIYPASKWIFDLRKYSGGDFKSFLSLTRLLINKKMPLFLETKKSLEKFLVGSDNSLKYKGLFIISSSTIMYSELLAFLLKIAGKTLVGSKTLGFMPRLSQFFLQDGSSVLLTSGFLKYQNQELCETKVIPQFEVKESQSETLIKYCIKLLKNI